ncbi:hypothetical protein pb186bvf_003239 [Paramecium bursaria]
MGIGCSTQKNNKPIAKSRTFRPASANQTTNSYYLDESDPNYNVKLLIHEERITKLRKI